MVACNMVIFFAGDTIGDKDVEESDPNSSSSRSSVVVPQYVAGQFLIKMIFVYVLDIGVSVLDIGVSVLD